MSIITREQREHVLIERDNIVWVRNAMVSDTQRAVRDLAYAGVDVQPLDLGGIRKGVTEFFSGWIIAAEARLEALDAELGNGPELRSYRIYNPRREQRLRDAKDWHHSLTEGLRNANHAAEEALIRAYEAAYPGVFNDAQRVPSISEAAE